MNVFKKFTETFNRDINQINQNINNTVDTVKDTLGIVDNSEVDTVFIELRNGRPFGGFKPDMIKDLSDEEARQYILKRIQDENINIDDETLPMYSNDEPSATLEPLATLPPAEEALIDEDTDELLQDPQTSDIFDELRSEFPGTTPTPVPPSIEIEGFEDVPLSDVEKINNDLKQKFIDNFTF